MDVINELKADLEKYVPGDLQKANGEEELLQKLAAHVQYLIDHQLEHLYQLLYRIDVSETKVKNIVATLPYAEHARALAEAILERQKQKIESRKKFKS